MTGFALTYRLTPDGAERRAEFDNRTAALGFRYGVTHWAAEVSAVVELDRPPFPWFRPGPGAPVDETVPVACAFCGGKPVSDAASWLDGQPRPPAPCPRCGEINFETGGTGAILDGSVAGAAEEGR